jgi:hypothetical protein
MLGRAGAIKALRSFLSQFYAPQCDADPKIEFTYYPI